jgi:hypothetical protein
MECSPFSFEGKTPQSLLKFYNFSGEFSVLLFTAFITIYGVKGFYELNHSEDIAASSNILNFH